MTELETSQKELKASIVKCKRLQKEKKALEVRLAEAKECERAHIEAGHEFAPGRRVYGTRVNIQELTETLIKYNGIVIMDDDSVLLDKHNNLVVKS